MSNEPLDRPIRLLQYQIQQRLDQDFNQVRGRTEDWRFDVLMRPSFTIGTGSISSPIHILRPALCVVEHLSVASPVDVAEVGPGSLIRWVLDIETDNFSQLSHGLEHGIAFFKEGSKARSKAECTAPEPPLAIADVCDYWCLRPASVELRIETLMAQGQQLPSRLLQVGERAIATALPDFALRLQEPLPLYFLTRTLTGQRTYAHQPLPLQVCGLPI